MADALWPVLKATNLRRSLAWYEKLGFEQESGPPERAGVPEVAIVVRGSMRIQLSEWPETPVGCIWVAVWDADAIGRQFNTGFVEDNAFELRDPAGNRVLVSYEWT
jgi:hypothetical protein